MFCLKFFMDTQNKSTQSVGSQGSGRGAIGDSRLTKALNGNSKYYWFMVLNMVLLSMLGSFVNDMYTPALPAMCRFFDCSVSLGQMGLTMGMIGLGLGQFILGPVSDKFGRKKVLIGSVGLFVVMAVASIFSPNIHIFNLCRLLQGVGASGGYFLARTIPTDVFAGRNLAKLMALVGAINGIAPASAPVIGGFTAHAWGWKGVFLLLAAFAFLLLLNSLRMKESLAPDKRLATSFWRSFGGYVTLLKNKPYMVHTWLKGTALGMLFAYISASPFILQTIYGLSQTQYGIIIGFNALFAAALLGIAGYMVGAIVSPLVGMGNILHSTAIVYAVLTLLVLILAIISRRLPADLEK